MATEPAPITIATLLASATQRLQSVSDNARLDAELLLSTTLGWPRTRLYTRAEQQLAAAQRSQFEALLQQRLAGQPVAYLLGQQEFWSLTLSVNDTVLVPRADTELLVDLTLKLAPNKAASVLELGTGSGAIALALATERPNWHLIASDISAAALHVAEHNARSLDLTGVTFIESDWFAELAGKQFDLIVSNPPYVCEDDPHLQSTGVRFEPRLALTSGADGLQAIRHITAQASQHLYPNGKLLIEHGFDQGNAVRNLLTESSYTDINTKLDAGGNERVSYGTFPGYS